MRRGIMVMLAVILIAAQGYLMLIPSNDDPSGEEIGDSAGVFYSYHTTIRINNESDLDSDHGITNPSAAGTKADPYIIDGWSINGLDKGPCIYIGNTTSDIVISNCTFRRASGSYNYYYWRAALASFNTTNITVEYCVFQNTNIRSISTDFCKAWDINNNTLNATFNLWMRNGYDIVISDNEFNNHGPLIERTNEARLMRNSFDEKGWISLWYTNRSVVYKNDLESVKERDFTGISLSQSDYNVIHSNNVSNSNMEGIELYSSSNNILENNRVWDIYADFSNQKAIGIYIDYGAYNRVSNNTCVTNMHGIYTTYTLSSHSVFTGNDCSRNTGIGMRITGDFNTVTRNICNDNSGNGIDLFDYDRGEVTWNTIHGNGWVGIHHDGRMCDISNNSLRENGDGISLHGSDVDQVKFNTLVRSGGIDADITDLCLISHNSISESSRSGVRLYRSNRNTVSENVLTGCNRGVEVVQSDKNNILRNVMTVDEAHHRSNLYNQDRSGILIDYSEDARCEDNEMTRASIRIKGYGTDQWTSHEFDGNTVNGKQVGYFLDGYEMDISSSYDKFGELIFIMCGMLNVHDMSMSDGTMGIQVAYCSNITMENISMSDEVRGMEIFQSTDVNIVNISMAGGTHGINVDASEGIDIDDCSISGYSYGVYLEGVSRSSIANCSIVHNGDYGKGIRLGTSHHILVENNVIGEYGAEGLDLRYSDDSIINNNTIYENVQGIRFDKDSNRVRISNNTIRYNLGNGIMGIEYGYDSPRNKIIQYNHITYNNGYGIETNGVGDIYHHNNLIGNNKGGVQASDNGTDNRWNTSSGEGNYWRDYTSRYPLAVNDGNIWTTPYQINGTSDGKDHYPLVRIVDLIPPMVEDLSDDICTTGDPYVFRSVASDNIGIDRVTATYWFGDQWESNETIMMSPSGEGYELEFSIPHTSDPMSYYITAYDSYGNYRRTPTRIHQIIDNDDPISIPGTDQEISDGVTLFLDGSNSTDNIGVVNHTWWFEYDDSEVALYGVNTSFTFEIPGEYQVYLNVSDAYGNSDNDSTTIDVLDATPPDIYLVNMNLSVDHRDQFTVFVNGSDKSGISEVRIVFSDLLGETFNGSMGLMDLGYWFFDIPPQLRNGSIDFFIWSQDWKGNEVIIGPYTLQIFDNVAPIINVTFVDLYLIGEYMKVEVEAYDLSGIMIVSILFMNTTDVAFVEDMYEIDDRYVFNIPPQYQSGNVTFRIAVIDGSGYGTYTDLFTITIISRIQDVIVDPGNNVTIFTGSIYHFNSSAFIGNGAFTYIAWEFDYNGVQKVLNGPNPSFQFDIPDEYRVKIKAMDTLGYMGYGNLTVTVVEGNPDLLMVMVAVKDTSGEPVRGALVEIQLYGNNYGLFTDDSGLAIFEFPGDYVGETVSVRITKDGYEDVAYIAVISGDGHLSPGAPSLEPEPVDGTGFVLATIAILLIIIILVAVLVAFFTLKGVASASGEEKETNDEEEETASETDLSNTSDQPAPPLDESVPTTDGQVIIPTPTLWESRPPDDDTFMDHTAEDISEPLYDEIDDPMIPLETDTGIPGSNIPEEDLSVIESENASNDDPTDEIIPR